MKRFRLRPMDVSAHGRFGWPDQVGASFLERMPVQFFRDGIPPAWAIRARRAVTPYRFDVYTFRFVPACFRHFFTYVPTVNGRQLNKRISSNQEMISRSRGLSQWRDKQRSLPVGEKIELIGRFILETRQLEHVKKSCKLSAPSSNNCSAKGC